MRIWLLVGVLLLLLTGFAVFRLALHWWVYHGRLDAIRAAGEPATFEDIDEARLKLLPEQDAAVVAREAFSHYDSRNVYLHNLPIDGIAILPDRTESLPPEMKADMAVYLQDNAEALRLLHRAAGMPHGRFFHRDEYQDFSSFRRGVKLLNMEAILAAETGDPATAASSFVDALRFGRHLRDEPFLISFLVHTGCEFLTVPSIERAINHARFTDGQLRMMGEALGDADDPHALRHAILTERCQVADVVSRPVTELLEKDATHSERLWAFFYGLAGVQFVDAGYMLDYYDEMARLADLSTHRRKAAAEALDAKGSKIPEYLILSRGRLPALGPLCDIDLRALAVVRAARTGLAVQRYCLAHGRCPEKLGDLVPEFLDAVPDDPFDGYPLRYRIRGSGFVVYSVGEDLTDNAGREEDARGKPFATATDIPFTVEFASAAAAIAPASGSEDDQSARPQPGAQP